MCRLRTILPVFLLMCIPFMWAPGAAIICPATTPLAAPMAPAAPAALRTGCLMMAEDTAAVPRLIILRPLALASPAAVGATAFGADFRTADKPGRMVRNRHMNV